MSERRLSDGWAEHDRSPYGSDRQARQRAVRMLMWLLLASLGMLFLSSLLGYGIIRTIGPKAPPLGAMRVPEGLYLSTLFLVASSLAIHVSISYVRRERQSAFRLAILGTLACGLGFLVVQSFSLFELWRIHHEAMHRDIFLYGLVLALILVHAAHVIGGSIPLGIVTHNAFRGRYDHESYAGVTYLAMYWHFLDVVWLLMLGVFVALG